MLPHTTIRTLLVVEDDPGDADLIQEAWRQRMPQSAFQVMPDGEAAIAYLRHEGPYQDAKDPELVLLDLNLPKRDGRDVLKTIREDARLRALPVVVLTTSNAERDIARAYQLGANCYITKPIGLTAFMRTIDQVETFWSSVAQLPPAGDPRETV
jgi:CheY-like chemotaxis protein